MASRTTKTTLSVLAVVVIALGGAFVLRALWDTAKSSLAADVCTVGPYDLDPEQAVVAATMVGAVTQYPGHLPERASVLVLAAALQESKLTNLPSGDRDSVGVLQQRPTYWGFVPGGPNSLAARKARLQNVGEATKEFLDALVKNVPGWRGKPLGQVVQAVQKSADVASGPSYAQHEAEAQTLADALQGIKPAAITCSFAEPTVVASTTKVAQQVATELGITSPTAVDARTVRVPGAHWQTTAWFVANADRLGIDQVAYAGHIWTRAHGWRKGTASTAAVTATMYDLKKK